MQSCNDDDLLTDGLSGQELGVAGPAHGGAATEARQKARHLGEPRPEPRHGLEILLRGRRTLPSGRVSREEAGV